MKLGAHVSIRGGVENAPLYGKAATCDVIQIFSKNQLQWKFSPLTDESVSLFKKRAKELNIEPVSIHASYLLNLASTNEAIRKKSIENLRVELERADMLGISYVVFHPGAHKGVGEAVGLKNISTSLNEVFKISHSKNSILLLETTAGEGTTLCYRFEHFAQIFDALDDTSRVGVCFDTCHVFAAGYDIRSKIAFEDVISEFDNIIGLSFLKLFHLNDSKRALGERIDRHEEIGRGKIGECAFHFLVNAKKFENISGILEIPGDIDGYKRNLKVLRGLIDG